GAVGRSARVRASDGGGWCRERHRGGRCGGVWVCRRTRKRWAVYCDGSALRVLGATLTCARANRVRDIGDEIQLGERQGAGPTANELKGDRCERSIAAGTGRAVCADTGTSKLH